MQMMIDILLHSKVTNNDVVEFVGQLQFSRDSTERLREITEFFKYILCPRGRSYKIAT